LLRKPQPSLPCDAALFRSIVKITFGQRRKMLRNTLRSFFSEQPEILKDDFFLKRPEQLSVQDFIELTLRVEETKRRS
jgi:16S rRNA (adenine1518-N6/adenine1519-N6)-dimethyltransferase